MYLIEGRKFWKAKTYSCQISVGIKQSKELLERSVIEGIKC